MEAKELNNESELKEIITKENLILMIHKHGCPFCEKAMPWLDEFSKKSKTKISKINKDNLTNLLDTFQVQMYPTFISIKEGKVSDIFFGDTQYDKVKEFVDKNQ